LSALDTPLINIGRTLTNIVGVKILEVNIPFSYYPVSTQINVSTNLPENQFSFQIPGDSANIIIPPGQYTGLTLAAAIESQLTAAITMFNLLPSPLTTFLTGTCSFSTVTGKFTMVVTLLNPTGVATPMNFLFQTPPTPLHPLAKLLGFTSNSIPAVATGANTIFTWSATNAATVTGPNILYVNSVILGNLCKAYLPQSILVTGETNPQMAMVPVNVNPGGIIWWQDPAPQEVFDTKNLFSLSQLDLYITAGTDPRPLLFNGLGFQVKLMLYVRYIEQGISQSGTIGQNRAVLQIRPT